MVGGSVSPIVLPTEHSSPSPLPASVRLVNSKQIHINYEVKDVGPAGLAGVEMYYTRDGREWHREENLTQARPYVVKVDEDGLYGLTLIAKSKTGMSVEPPRPGDTPQIWVEVRTTKPEVRLVSTDPSANATSRSLTVHWSATDKYLGARPITLSYSEKPEGPWVPFASNIENTGSYVWEMPSTAPRRLLVRVDATDDAGNTGTAQAANPVVVDLTPPTIAILGVEGSK